MDVRLPELLAEEHIDTYGALSLRHCRILKPYLLEKNGLTADATAIFMILPYHGGVTPENLSVYASVRDYHGYFEGLYRRLTERLSAAYPGYRFCGFTDHSPVDEVNGAARCGLGLIGDNGLLIHPRYASFVYVAELITDAPPALLGLSAAEPRPVQACLHCGACAKACPSDCMREGGSKRECMSAVTQKKGEFTPEEAAAVLALGSAWGCDVCQNVCPYTKKAMATGAIRTPIPYFLEDTISRLTKDYVESLTDGEFNARPFAWRGKAPILRNLELLEREK
ncbi:MAG: epoxyqueuosine reductase [Clostridia bacterium]|nr:epoxyqueuosine reductase [Clostridia bacterium]